MSRVMMEKVIEEYTIKEKDKDVTDTTDDDVTIVVSNSKVQSRDHEPSVECNNVIMEMISSMINKVLVEDKSELRAINRKYAKITTKLSLRYNNKLEYCNLMLGKRVMALDKINDKCYWYIGELNQEVIRLENELHENNESLEWRPLRSDNMDGVAEIDIISDSSVESYRYNEYLEYDKEYIIDEDYGFE